MRNKSQKIGLLQRIFTALPGGLPAQPSPGSDAAAELLCMATRDCPSRNAPQK